MCQIVKPLPEWFTQQLCDELIEVGFACVAEPTIPEPTFHIWKAKEVMGKNAS